jgi:hypothetical protein
MQVFARVVDLGGFTAAAREFRLTPSGVSKLVSRLEARLGSRLVNRSTRKLQLTPEGYAFYVRATRIPLVSSARPAWRLLPRPNTSRDTAPHQLQPILRSIGVSVGHSCVPWMVGLFAVGLASKRSARHPSCAQAMAKRRGNLSWEASVSRVYRNFISDRVERAGLTQRPAPTELR